MSGETEEQVLFGCALFAVMCLGQWVQSYSFSSSLPASSCVCPLKSPVTDLALLASAAPSPWFCGPVESSYGGIRQVSLGGRQPRSFVHKHRNGLVLRSILELKIEVSESHVSAAGDFNAVVLGCVLEDDGRAGRAPHCQNKPKYISRYLADIRQLS